MRVYVPSTSTALGLLLDTGAVAAGDDGIAAFAVTPGLRRWLAAAGSAQPAEPADPEELEYVAQAEAARASLRLLEADPTASRRRAVVAADVPDAAVDVRDEPDAGLVRVREAIALAAVASVHLDDLDAEAAIAAAAEAIGSADEGDLQSVAVVDDADAYELAWYATQELAAVLDAL